MHVCMCPYIESHAIFLNLCYVVPLILMFCSSEFYNAFHEVPARFSTGEDSHIPVSREPSNSVNASYAYD